MKVFALVPAAGRSRRMGRPKLLLPAPPLRDDKSDCGTVIEHVISSVRAAGVERVVIVTTHELKEVQALSKAAGAEVAVLPSQTADMRATVETGLEWIERTWSPGGDDYFLLVPADHPLLSSQVVKHLLSTADESRRQSIFVPVHERRRGHPTLLSWRHAAGIRAYPKDRGINQYIRDHADEVLELSVEEPGILCDIDTPEDYVRLKAIGRG